VSACVIFILHQKIQKMAKCTFWYQLTRVVPDKVQRVVKWLCVCCVYALNLFILSSIIQLESKEMKRLRSNLLLVYRILFGLMHISCLVSFTLRKRPHLCAAKYVLNKERDFSTRRDFISHRVLNLWNSLPVYATYFTSLRKVNNLS